MTDVLVSRVSDRLPDGIGRLRDLSEAEGHRHIARLIQDWDTGVLRFSEDNEILLAAHVGAALVGVGGMTVGPCLPTALRMRRFYVDPAWRGQGIARRLVEELLQTAPLDRDIVAHAPTGAVAFWQALGFRPCRAEHHNMRLPRPAENIAT